MRKARLGVSAALAVAMLAGAASPAGAHGGTGQSDDKEKGTAAQAPNTPAPTPPPPSLARSKIERWLDLRTASVLARYRRVETSAGMISSNQLQDSLSLKGRVKLDPRGAYAVNAGVGTGVSFTGGWNNVGVGTGGRRVTNIYLKQLFLTASPVNGFELSYGGFGFVRGESTEITSYDNDGYLVGFRATLKRPKNLYLDEISFTNGYLGDTDNPNVMDRFSRLDEANYRHVLVGKTLGKLIAASADYTRLAGAGTIRAAVNLQTPKARVIDFLRYEQYRGLGAGGSFGFSAYAEKALHNRLSLGMGYADIDPAYGDLNADRFNKGRRFFEQVSIKAARDFTVSAFLTQAVQNSFAVSNERRVDAVVTYNVLGPIQRAGLFR